MSTVMVPPPRRPSAPPPRPLSRRHRQRVAPVQERAGDASDVGIAVLVALVPAGADRRLRDQPGHARCSRWSSSPSDIPTVTRADARGGMGPAHRRHPDHHRRGHADGDPARDPRWHLPQRVRRQRAGSAGSIRFIADVMTGVPSIVMGLFIYTVWVLALRATRASPAALALACLMLPVVIRTTEEMLRLVPQDLRQASVRARRPQGGAPILTRRPARRRARHHQRRAARRSPGPRARPPRCSSRSAPPSA